MTNYAREAAPVELLKTQLGEVARIQCDQCGAKDDWRMARRPPPEILPKHFTNKGWDLRKRSLCPSCAKPKEKKMATVTPISKAEASEAAKKVKRLIYMALEDYYDDSASAYRDGYSDASIAKEVGAAESFVKSIRESDFGPIKPPTEFEEIRSEVNELASQIGKLTTRLQQIASKNSWVN